MHRAQSMKSNQLVLLMYLNMIRKARFCLARLNMETCIQTKVAKFYYILEAQEDYGDSDEKIKLNVLPKHRVVTSHVTKSIFQPKRIHFGTKCMRICIILNS